MLVNLATLFFGLFIFLFIFWKKMKEDYAAEIIFKSASYILTGVVIGFLVSKSFFAEWFLFSEFFGVLVGVYIAMVRFKLKFYEILDSTILAFLPWVSLMFLSDSVTQLSFNSFMSFLFMLVVIFLYYYFDTHYRNFAWYKSGKVGFSGLLSLAIIFITRSALATFGITVISFVNKYEAIVSGLLAFITFLMLFRLSRKS